MGQDKKNLRFWEWQNAEEESEDICLLCCITEIRLGCCNPCRVFLVSPIDHSDTLQDYQLLMSYKGRAQHVVQGGEIFVELWESSPSPWGSFDPPMGKSIVIHYGDDSSFSDTWNPFGNISESKDKWLRKLATFNIFGQQRSNGASRKTIFLKQAAVGIPCAHANSSEDEILLGMA